MSGVVVREQERTVVYQPLVRPGFAAWVTGFDYDEERIGLSFKETIAQARQDDPHQLAALMSWSEQQDSHPLAQRAQAKGTTGGVWFHLPLLAARIAQREGVPEAQIEQARIDASNEQLKQLQQTYGSKFQSVMEACNNTLSNLAVEFGVDASVFNLPEIRNNPEVVKFFYGLSQRMKEAGTFTGTPQDIGTLIKMVQADLLEEEKENILRDLWKWAGPHVTRRSTRGLPEWYKSQMASGELREAA